MSTEGLPVAALKMCGAPAFFLLSVLLSFVLKVNAGYPATHKGMGFDITDQIKFNSMAKFFFKFEGDFPSSFICFFVREVVQNASLATRKIVAATRSVST